MMYRTEFPSYIRPIISLDNILVWNGGVIEKNIMNRLVNYICQTSDKLRETIITFFIFISKELNIIIDKFVSLLFKNNLFSDYSFHYKLLCVFIIVWIFTMAYEYICKIYTELNDIQCRIDRLNSIVKSMKEEQSQNHSQYLNHQNHYVSRLNKIDNNIQKLKREIKMYE